MAQECLPVDVKAIVRSDPAIMGGEPCFRGTRIPISVLFSNLEAGVSLAEILESYPTLDNYFAKRPLLRGLS
jgi:uncharacterized protein (DUF433 family)